MHPLFARLLEAGESGEDSAIAIGKHPTRAVVLHADPKLVLFHNMVTPEEAEALIQLGGPRWVQSHTVSGLTNSYSRTSATRTSTTAPIGHMRTPVVMALAQRLRDLTGVRHVQVDLLRYEKDQEFRVHHDGEQREFTFVIYLSDLLGDDDGGETEFPILKLRVKPRRGTAVFFRNTLPTTDGPPRADNRMIHSALPVRTSDRIKYVVNAWLIPDPSGVARPNFSPET
jgi:prolyl 4-hydroxylase